MAHLYTEQDKDKILRTLKIDPQGGKVDGNEAAKILTWRAKKEHKIDYAYNGTAIRQHVRSGHFPEGTINQENERRNLYAVDIVFILPISPKRGAGKKKKQTKARI